jgi:hypothetical protein
MAGDFLAGVGKYLHLVAPDRAKELSAAIRARAGELAEADKDMVADQPSEGVLGIGAAVLASFETLLPLFDGDERRTVLYLRHVMGKELTRPYETAFETLSERKNSRDRTDKACRAEEPFYGAGRDIDFERPEPSRFEMNVRSMTAWIAGNPRTNDLVKRRRYCPPSSRGRPSPLPRPRGGVSAFDDKCTHCPSCLGCDKRILS